MSTNGRREKPIDPIREMREAAMKAQLKRQAEIESEADDLVDLYRENGYSFEEAMAELEVARRAALNKGDMGALVAATTAKAKLAGLMIDRQAVLHASAQEGAHDLTGDAQEGILASVERLKGRAGDAGISSRVVERLLDVLRDEGILRDRPNSAIPELPPR